ncbi:hypothetical protein GGI10_005231, partial [Coemansia sp. RSA 2530]
MAAELDITYDLGAYKYLEAVAEKPELLCTVGIAREHPLLDLERREEIGTIAKIEFVPNVKSSVIQGKAKKHSMKVVSDTKICTIHTSTGKEFIVRAA